MNGLTREQVEEKIEQGLVNRAVDSGAKTNKQIIMDNLFTYFNVIFMILSVLVCVAGSFRSLTFLPVVVGNTLIGIIQEIRARNVLEKMNLLNASHTTAIRDGKEVKVASEELVQGDLVIFRAGDQIPADAVVIEGCVQANESLLTGESDEIEKNKGDKLMSGSFVISGECYAELEKVGEESYISKLTLEAKKGKRNEQSEMIKSINKLIMWVGIAIIPIGIVLYYQAYFVNGESFSESIVSMVAAVIGMIPEGLYLLTTIALAMSTVRLAKEKVLLHNMKSIETLARVDVLCVDKTGTITENKMEVHGIEAINEMFGREETTIEIISDFVENMTADNITMAAMKEYFKNTTNRKALSYTSFSSEFKYSSVTYADEVFVLGAPEMVLRDEYETYRELIERYSKKGLRTLVFGKYYGEIDGKALTEEVVPYALVFLSNKIREQAKETFEYFKQQNVQIKVISGDNPGTVSEIAKEAGIDGAEKYIDARELKDDMDFVNAVNEYNVFGRVTPKQKQQLVHALQNKGHTVAMTGDGVNDILAMKDADCSIAMASGSEATAQSAQVVLLESDFSKMPSVVLEGRRVVNNVQRSASLFLVKNIFSFLMSIFSAVFMITYPLEPSQISLISMFNIGIPAFLLAMEANKKRIEGKFLRNVFIKALPAGLTDFFAVAALVVCGKVFKLPSADIATAATMLLAIVGFMILSKISVPLNRYRMAVIAGNIAGLLLCSIFLGDIFALNGMSKICILLFVVFSFASESVFRLLYEIAEKISEKFKTESKK